MSARAYPFSLTLPTYEAELASRLAPLFEKGKVPVYPYTQFVRTGETSRPHTYTFLALENRFLRALIAPALGGRVYSIRDKRLRAPADDQAPGHELGAELLYANRVVKPYRVEPRNAWISAGIEINFPVAHSHTSVEPVAQRHYEQDGRAYAEVGETERRLGLQWLVRYSLGDDDAFLTQETFLHNPTQRPAKWQLWSNCGVDAYADSEFIYPPAKLFVHNSKDQYDRWPMNWSKVGEREGMLGLFWLDQTDVYYGIFHHSRGYGTLHLADPKVVPGMKLWTFGWEGTKRWADLLSDDHRGYAEIQSGAFKTQEEFGTMAPGQGHRYVEFWTGADSVEAIRKAELPQPKLGKHPPQWFGMEHISEAQVWLKLLDAHRRKAHSAIPAYDPAGTDWPPPGLELEQALRWAAGHKAVFRTALGTWLAARDRFADASAVLEDCGDDYGRRVRGLLAWRIERNLPKARQEFERIGIDDTGHLLDHDALLAHMGDHAAREKILGRLPSQEGRVVERVADRLVGAGRPQEAIDTLMARPWVLQHERWIRTDIWRRARAALGQDQDPVPKELAEDPVPPVSEVSTPHGPMDGVLRRVPDHAPENSPCV